MVWKFFAVLDDGGDPVYDDEGDEVCQGTDFDIHLADLAALLENLDL